MKLFDSSFELVQAILALIIFIGIIGTQLLYNEVPEYMVNFGFALIGYYFGKTVQNVRNGGR